MCDYENKWDAICFHFRRFLMFCSRSQLRKYDEFALYSWICFSSFFTPFFQLFGAHSRAAPLKSFSKTHVHRNKIHFEQIYFNLFHSRKQKSTIPSSTRLRLSFLRGFKNLKIWIIFVFILKRCVWKWTELIICISLAACFFVVLLYFVNRLVRE